MAFIVDAWKRSYESSPAVRGCDREHYRVEMTRAIRRLCDKATIRVACAENDPDTLVGFAVFSAVPGVAWSELHYVYVKRDFRRMGIARQLLSGVDVSAYTFSTPSVRAPKSWAFTPRFTIT